MRGLELIEQKAVTEKFTWYNLRLKRQIVQLLKLQSKVVHLNNQLKFT